MRASLFETLHLYAPDGQPIELGSPTARSLIAYLLLNRTRPTDRRRLAFTFWPKSTESVARRNLRQYLHQIRTILAPIDPGGTLLLAKNSSIQFNPKIEFNLDVDTFLFETRPDAVSEEIRHALSVYEGDLLEDIYDDWCVSERARLRQTWLETLDRYSQILQGAGKMNEALAVVKKWVKAEPFDEGAQRRLMRLHALSGERVKAIQTYHAFAQSLRLELDTEPLPDTQALLHSIQNGHAVVESDTPNIIPTQRRTATPRPQSVSAFLFHWQKKEIASLVEANQAAGSGTGRLVLVTGEAGIGKTRLVQEYLELHSDLSALQSACYELDSMVPFAPLRQALESSHLFDSQTRAQLPPSWATTLIPILPELGHHFPYANFPVHQVDGIILREALLRSHPPSE